MSIWRRVHMWTKKCLNGLHYLYESCLCYKPMETSPLYWYVNSLTVHSRIMPMIRTFVFWCGLVPLIFAHTIKIYFTSIGVILWFDKSTGEHITRMHKSYDITITQHNTTKPCIYFMECTVIHGSVPTIVMYRQTSNISRTFVGNKLLITQMYLGRCSNYISILDFTPGFNKSHKDNCKARRETFKSWDLMSLIWEIWW